MHQKLLRLNSMHSNFIPVLSSRLVSNRETRWLLINKLSRTLNPNIIRIITSATDLHQLQWLMWITDLHETLNDSSIYSEVRVGKYRISIARIILIIVAVWPIYRKCSICKFLSIRSFQCQTVQIDPSRPIRHVTSRNDNLLRKIAKWEAITCMRNNK